MRSNQPPARIGRPPKAIKQSAVSLSIKTSLLDYARAQAAAEDMSLSSYIARMLERSMRVRSTLKKS